MPRGESRVENPHWRKFKWNLKGIKVINEKGQWWRWMNLEQNNHVIYYDYFKFS
jgi:hypothetical protein